MDPNTLANTTATTNDEVQKKQLEFIFHYGSYILWKYLLKKFNIDLSDVYAKIPSEEPFIMKDNIKFTMRIVQHDFKSNIDKKYYSDISFFVNAVNTVFNTFKAGLESNGKQILADYTFQLDNNFNLYLDSADEFRLGVMMV